jgi:gluconokinase
VPRSLPNKKPIILAIDVGSSSTRSSLFDSGAEAIPKTAASEHYSIRYGPDGAAELSPLVLLRAVNRCVSATLNRAGNRRVTAVSISSFWHGLLGLNARWRPLTPIFTWADARAAGAARDLRKMMNETRVHSLTGCRLHTSFWPAKLRWLRTDSPALFQKVALWVSPADWMLHRLFGTTHTTPSMASGTGLFNLGNSQWDNEICRALQLSRKKLPKIESHPVIATAKSTPLHSVAITMIGDGAASNLGSGASAKGVVAINVGTSAAVRVISTARRSKIDPGLFRYVLDNKRFVVGGAISNAGNLREWALRELWLGQDSRAKREAFSRTAAARDSLVVLPFWANERAPTWPEDASGVIYGLNPTVTATEIMRSLATASFYRLAQILEILDAHGQSGSRIIVSGGILQSPKEVCLLADSIGHDVEISRIPEASLRGAAVFALEQQGIRARALPLGRLVKHNRALAKLHAKRRAKQEALEIRLTSEL